MSVDKEEFAKLVDKISKIIKDHPIPSTMLFSCKHLSLISSTILQQPKILFTIILAVLVGGVVLISGSIIKVLTNGAILRREIELLKTTFAELQHIQQKEIVSRKVLGNEMQRMASNQQQTTETVYSLKAYIQQNPNFAERAKDVKSILTELQKKEGTMDKDWKELTKLMREGFDKLDKE